MAKCRIYDFFGIREFNDLIMLQSLKKNIGRTIVNLKGWRTDKKIIVFESDDWGSIRMPNKQVYDLFQEKGFDLSNNPYCQYDTLANSNDLEALFEVLLKHKDQIGNHPVITANTVVANPDFEKIKESGFQEYYYKPFTETIKEYYPEEDVFTLWKVGIKKKIFMPQYHGREHVNVALWLNFLRENNTVFMNAFDMGFWGLPNNLYTEKKNNIQASYDSASIENLNFYKKSIEEGLILFEKIFNFKSSTFIANNYTWSSSLNETLLKCGVSAFQGMKYQKEPTIKGVKKLILNFTGKYNEFGQLYLVRNCVFEPSQMPKSFNNIEDCLKSISSAFKFKRPAIIACHRLNFIGAIRAENRNQNLEMFDELLTKIINKWPDVTFMSSDQLAHLIKNNDKQPIKSHFYYSLFRCWWN